MHQRFSIYWRGRDRGLFAFRQDVVASSVREALARFRSASCRAAAIPYGVKGRVGCGHCSRWFA